MWDLRGRFETRDLYCEFLTPGSGETSIDSNLLIRFT
jgi:hypothetical protein